MQSENNPPGEEPPSSARLAALTIVAGALSWCGAAFFFRQAPLAVRPEEGIAPLILFGLVGTLLFAAGSYGLWRSSSRPGA